MAERAVLRPLSFELGELQPAAINPPKCSSQPSKKPGVQEAAGKSAKCQVPTIAAPHRALSQIISKINHSGVCVTNRASFHHDYIVGGIEMQESTMNISGHERASVVVTVADDVKELWKEGA